ncbi:hypothetical protein ABPG72_006424 [Tetrahymena utriculariae]
MIIDINEQKILKNILWVNNFYQDVQLKDYLLLMEVKDSVYNHSFQNNIHQLKQTKVKEQIKCDTLPTDLYEEDHVENIEGLDTFIQKLLNQKQSKTKFTDSQFPPNQNSLFQSDSPNNIKTRWSKYKWIRCSEFMASSNYKMFSKNDDITQSRQGLGKLITPYNIYQGDISDCYFLSVVSCISIHPERILDLFITRNLNKYGIYCIKLCINGIWSAVTIDDYLPLDNQNQFAFNSPHNYEMWVCFLEKAWAKINKCYEYINFGHDSESFRVLTGSPTLEIKTKINAKIDGVIKKQMNLCLLPIIFDVFSQQNKFLISASVSVQHVKNYSKYKQLGLVVNHCYSLINVKEINHPKEGKVTLLKIRNPWGQHEWRGKWSRNSSIWTKELDNELKVKSLPSGTFYMSFKSFCKYFFKATICYYHDFFVKISYKVDKSDFKHSQYFKITVSVKGTYYISLIKPNPRANTWNYQQYLSRIYLVQVQNDDFQQIIKYVGGKKGTDLEVYQQFNLEPGVYILQAKLYQEYVTPYVVSSYGIMSTLIEQINKTEVPKGFLQDSLIQYARRYCEPEKDGSSNIVEYTCINQNIGYGFYYIQNFSFNKYDILVKVPKSVKVKKPYKLQFSSAPNTEEIVILKRNKDMQQNKKYIQVQKTFNNLSN